VHAQLKLSAFLKVTESVFHFISVAACADSRLHAEIDRLIYIVLIKQTPYSFVLLPVLFRIVHSLINTAAAVFGGRAEPVSI
jgi:hypothetical protein